MTISIKSLNEGPGQLLRRAHQLSSAIAMERLTPFGLTPLQFGALIVLHERPGLDAKTLCAALALDRASLTGLLDRMEAGGLVTRETHPDDRRARVLTLTAFGEETFAQSSATASRSQNAVLDALTPAERATFMALLGKLVRVQTERVSRRAVDPA